MIEVVIKGLPWVAEINYIFSNRFEILVFYKDPGDKVRDSFHIVFIHAKAGHFDGADAQPAGAIPVFRRFRDKVLVGDDIRLGQTVGYFQPASILFHTCDDLMTLSIAFVRTQHRDAAFVRACSAFEFFTIWAI